MQNFPDLGWKYRPVFSPGAVWSVLLGHHLRNTPRLGDFESQFVRWLEQEAQIKGKEVQSQSMLQTSNTQKDLPFRTEYVPTRKEKSPFGYLP